jgi:hypothetical protein
MRAALFPYPRCRGQDISSNCVALPLLWFLGLREDANTCLFYFGVVDIGSSVRLFPPKIIYHSQRVFHDPRPGPDPRTIRFI